MNLLKYSILFLFLPTALFAQTEEPSFASCDGQIKEFCPAEKTPGSILKCLLANESQITLQCKEEIKRVARALEQVDEQGGRALSVLGGLSSQAPPFPVIAYEGIYGDGKPAISDQRLNISTPIYQSEEDYFAISLAGAQVHLDKELTLTPGLQAPTDLTRLEIGSQYTRQLSGHRNWGIKGSIGYAADQISGKFNDTVYSLNLNYGYPTASGGFWNFFLLLSDSGPFGKNIPMPGFVYFFKTEDFTALLGFPVLSLQWTPSKDWAYSISALGPAITTEVAYGQIREIQYFTAASWNNQSFKLKKREEDEDRLTIEDKTVAAGARSFIFDYMLAEAKAGYSFDRQIYVGQGIRDMRRGYSEIDAGAFLTISIKSGF